jgi:hypothetical protein
MPRTNTNCTNEIPAEYSPVCGHAQFCDQVSGSAGEVQRHRIAKIEVERAVELRLPADKRLWRAKEDPYEADKH